MRRGDQPYIVRRLLGGGEHALEVGLRASTVSCRAVSCSSDRVTLWSTRSHLASRLFELAEALLHRLEVRRAILQLEEREPTSVARCSAVASDDSRRLA
jgi:hypothetical protein